MPRARLSVLICEMGMVTACPQRNENACCMNVLGVSIQKWPLSTYFIVGQGEEGSLALVRVGAPELQAGERVAQLSLGRAGTLARAGSSRVYMSTPRRNTAS